MNYLLAGSESKERVEILFSLTSISSECLIDAIIMHLTTGKSDKGSAILNGVEQQNLNRAMVKLNKVAEKVEAIKTLDWHHLTDVNKGTK